MEINVGDIVEYIDDWKENRQWYVYSIENNGLCRIVLIKNGKYTNEKKWIYPFEHKYCKFKY